MGGRERTELLRRQYQQGWQQRMVMEREVYGLGAGVSGEAMIWMRNAVPGGRSQGGTTRSVWGFLCRSCGMCSEFRVETQDENTGDKWGWRWSLLVGSSGHR